MKQKIRLLLVDNQEEIINSIKLYVGRKSLFEVVGTANSGKGCLEWLKEKDNYTDVLLMDINMETVETGILVAEEVLRRKKSPKVIFLTSFSKKYYRDKAVKMGCSLIDKAFSIPLILNCIEVVFLDEEQMQVILS